MKKPESQVRTRLITLILCVFPTLICLAARGQVTKPKLRVAADGFPSGHDTPEGAACDLARAFINRDAGQFAETCIKPYANGKSQDDYATFLKRTIESIKLEAAKTEPSTGGPKAIGKVFAARHLTMDGPASY